MTLQLCRRAALVLCMVVLASCSGGEDHARRTYVAACTSGLGNQDLCSCMYNKLREAHSYGEIEKATEGEPPSPKLAYDTAKALESCLKDAKVLPPK